MRVSHITVIPSPLPEPAQPPAVAVDPAAITPFQDELPIPPVFTPRKNKGGDAACKIVLRNKLVQLHRALGRVTPVWSYDIPKQGRKGVQWVADDRYLGPTLEVTRGDRLTVTYANELCGTLPVTAVQVNLDPLSDPAAADPQTANEPGRSNTPIIAGTDQVYAWAVTHLHGGRTAAMYDGWTENAMLPPRIETETFPDGTTRKTEPKGETQVSVYENNQRATLLWYHDHAMGITRFNVFAGLAGAYIIRDPAEEERLKAKGFVLPAGKQFDVPLVLQDRNLDAGDDGRLNGRLLHKSTHGTSQDNPGTAEFFGPYTLVNGVIWPKMTVRRRRYRFRVLNGSNARTYCLKLVLCDAEGRPTTEEVPLNSLVRQIGTDGGLLPRPVPLPDGAPVPKPADGKPVPTTDGLILAPAERADLYVDFSRLDKKIKSVALVNTAFAPFHQSTVQHPDPSNAETDPTTNQPVPAGPAGTAVAGMRLKYPCVMRFDLRPAGGKDPATDLISPPAGLDLTLAEDDGPDSHADLPGAPDPHGHRLVALVENPPGMLMMYELAETTVAQAGQFTPLAEGGLITVEDVDAQGNPVFSTYQPGPHGQFTPIGAAGPIAIRDADEQGNLVTKTYVPVATRFEDRVAFYAPYGRWENWKLLNLTEDTHPFHIHLVQFRILERRLFDVSGFDPTKGFTPPNTPIAYRNALGVVDDNEKGWKDTVRVNPGEMLSLALRCDGFTGRYMYHCHILEHEDRDMMRLFVATPGPVMALMADSPMLDGMSGMGGMAGMAGGAPPSPAGPPPTAPEREEVEPALDEAPPEAPPATRFGRLAENSLREDEAFSPQATEPPTEAANLLALAVDSAPQPSAASYTVHLINKTSNPVVGIWVGPVGHKPQEKTWQRIAPPIPRTCNASTSCDDCWLAKRYKPLYQFDAEDDPFDLYVLIKKPDGTYWPYEEHKTIDPAALNGDPSICIE